MSEQGAPLRFATAILSLWGIGRACWIFGVEVESPATASRTMASKHPIFAAPSTPALTAWLSPLSDQTRHGSTRTVALPPPEPFARSTPAIAHTQLVALARPAVPRSEILTPNPPSPASPRLDLNKAVAVASRWSGSVWLFVREGSHTAPLAALGQLGGSQAGARIRWRLNPGSQVRTALYGRVSSPLEDCAGAEAAIGAEWHPLPGKSVWIAAERRIALGKNGRNAWSAYAAGGFWKPGLPMDFTLDGYAQAGVVGAKSRDLFADGSLRISKAIVAESGPRLGAGIWGAAQPGAARLDVGPHARLPIKVASQPFSISADYRVRVAGDAVPRSGVAVTLASDF